MFRVMGTLQERNVALLGRIQQRLAGGKIIVQLGTVSALEFFPFGRVVAEPATQLIAGRRVLTPGCHVQRLLFHPARPQAFNQESRAILFCGQVIHSFDLDRRRLHL